MAAQHILIADDDPNQVDLLTRYLQREGFAVDTAHDGTAALAQAATRRPDLVILDVMMPGTDGLEVCRRLGGEQGIPVVLLTARSTEHDVLLGLYLGADDYITKPFSPRELVARVRTVLRRAQRPDTEAEQIVVGPIVLRPHQRDVRVGGVAVELTRTEFDILQALLARPGHVVSRRQLLESLHGDASYLTERTVDSHVKNLRRKLKVDQAHSELLATVYGVGYKLATGQTNASDPHA